MISFSVFQVTSEHKKYDLYLPIYVIFISNPKCSLLWLKWLIFFVTILVNILILMKQVQKNNKISFSKDGYFVLIVFSLFWCNGVIPVKFNKVLEYMFALSLKFTISCYLLEIWYLKISTQFLFGLSFYGHLKFLGFTGYFCIDFPISTGQLYHMTFSGGIECHCLIIIQEEHQKKLNQMKCFIRLFSISTCKSEKSQ